MARRVAKDVIDFQVVSFPRHQGQDDGEAMAEPGGQRNEEAKSLAFNILPQILERRPSR